MGALILCTFSCCSWILGDEELGGVRVRIRVRFRGAVFGSITPGINSKIQSKKTNPENVSSYGGRSCARAEGRISPGAVCRMH